MKPAKQIAAPEVRREDIAPSMIGRRPRDRCLQAIRAALVAYQGDSKARGGRNPSPSQRNHLVADVEALLRDFSKGVPTEARPAAAVGPGVPVVAASIERERWFRTLNMVVFQGADPVTWLEECRGWERDREARAYAVNICSHLLTEHPQGKLPRAFDFLKPEIRAFTQNRPRPKAAATIAL